MPIEELILRGSSSLFFLFAADKKGESIDALLWERLMMHTSISKGESVDALWGRVIDALISRD